MTGPTPSSEAVLLLHRIRAPYNSSKGKFILSDHEAALAIDTFAASRSHIDNTGGPTNEEAIAVSVAGGQKE